MLFFVSPLYLKMESEKGQSKGVLPICNTSSQPIRVSLSATAFTYDRDGSFRRLESNGKSQGVYINDDPKIGAGSET